MTKRGRFALGIVVTIALLVSLILTAGSVAALPNLPDPGNPGPLLPPPVLATATPTPVPEEEDEEDEDQEEDGDEEEDDGPGQPEATSTPSPRVTAAPTTPARATPTSRANRRGACTLWTTSSSNHGGSFPALSTPAGTVSASSVGLLLGSGFSVNYGDGPFTLSAARNCTSVEEKYLNGGGTSISDCPSDGYGPWRLSGSAYCVRSIPSGFWR